MYEETIQIIEVVYILFLSSLQSLVCVLFTQDFSVDTGWVVDIYGHIWLLAVCWVAEVWAVGVAMWGCQQHLQGLQAALREWRQEGSG